jgi:hypothetical protein
MSVQTLRIAVDNKVWHINIGWGQRDVGRIRQTGEERLLEKWITLCIALLELNLENGLNVGRKKQQRIGHLGTVCCGQ